MASMNQFFNIYNSLSEEDLLKLYNKYCDVTNSEARIYKMTEFNDYAKENIEPLDLISKIEFYSFNASETYFSFNEKGKIVSFTNTKDWRSPVGFSFSEKMTQLTEEQQSEILEDFIS